LKDVIDQLTGANPFLIGDSTEDSYTVKMKDFIHKLEKIQKGEMLDVTLILDDPCGNSYLQVKINCS
jgi:zinc finger protein